MDRVVWRFVASGVLALALAVQAGPLAAAPKHKHTSTTPAQIHRSGPIALDARLAGDERRTRLIVDLSKKVELSVFTLGDPYRVVMDLPNVSFDLPANSGRAGRGLISAYRYGVIGPGKARIVLDAIGPVKIERSFVQAGFEDQPARLVVDLAATDVHTFRTQLAAPATPVQTAAVTPAAGDTGRPAPARLQTQEKPVIIIDPGHGGIDSGAIGVGGKNEKDIVLAVALRLRQKLQESGRYRVVLTRSDDTFIPLAERVKVARTNEASLFISLHADYIPKREGDARGATIYTVSDRASDKEAARLAEKENKADLIAGLDLSKQTDDIVNILYDLTHRETKNFSSLFQRTLVGQMKTGGVLLHQRPARSAGFVVLKAPDVPSVLVELGYVSNAKDMKNLTSEEWRDKVTDSIAASIRTFFAEHSALAAAH